MGKAIIFLVLGILMIGIAYAQIELGDTQGGVVLETPEDEIISNLTEAIANTIFWRLDGTNAPPTADWNMGDYGFTGLDDLLFTDSIELGNAVTSAHATGGIAIGDNALSSNSYATAIGWGADARELSTIAIGFTSVAVDVGGIAIGDRASANSQYSSAIGQSAGTTGKYSIALGDASATNGEEAIAIGFNSGAINESAITIGSYSTNYGNTSMLLGDSCSADDDNTLTICYNETIVQNITADYFIGDGSALTNLPEADFTNVAYLNNTQTFTGENSFTEQVTILNETLRIDSDDGFGGFGLLYFTMANMTPVGTTALDYRDIIILGDSSGSKPAYAMYTAINDAQDEQTRLVGNYMKISNSFTPRTDSKIYVLDMTEFGTFNDLTGVGTESYDMVHHRITQDDGHVVSFADTDIDYKGIEFDWSTYAVRKTAMATGDVNLIGIDLQKPNAIQHASASGIFNVYGILGGDYGGISNTDSYAMWWEGGDWVLDDDDGKIRMGENHQGNLTSMSNGLKVEGFLNVTDGVCDETSGQCLSDDFAEVTQIVNQTVWTRIQLADQSASGYEDSDYLNFSVEANKNYTFVARLIFSASTDVDGYINFTRPAGEIQWSWIGEDADGLTTYYCDDCPENADPFETTTNLPILDVEGGFRPTASGDFILKFKKFGGITDLSLKEGSVMTLREVTE